MGKGGQVRDLKLHVEKAEWVRGEAGKNGQRSETCMFLSNLDQVVLYPIETVYYFKAKEGSSSEGVVERLREALRKLLGPYNFLAGRLRLNEAEHRLELLCNDAGVLFAGATSDLALDDLGDVTFVANPAFAGLVLQITDAPSLADLPLVSIQVTRFKCGGFTLGFSSNHALLDGISAGEFLANYACLARGDGLKVFPKPDRTMLKARSPPTVQYEHFEYVWLPGVPFSEQVDPTLSYTEQDALVAAMSMGRPLEDHAYQAFHVSGVMLERLKQEAHLSCTSFEALAAHLWQCRTAALGMAPFEISSFLFAVNLRERLHPPLPVGFAGNAVLSARARARTCDLISNPLWFAVQKVQEARAKITDQYIRSAIDCLEVHKGVPLSNSGCYVSAWSKIIQLHNLDFGWGPAIHAGPVVSSLVDYVLFISDGTSQGVIVLTAMPAQFLPMFHSLFLNFPTSTPLPLLS